MVSFRGIHRLGRRYLRHPRVFALARRAMLLAQYAMRRPDEPDYMAFKPLRAQGTGLIVDIGANGGQSAVAFAWLLPKFQILSFEPNPALWRELDFVARVLGKRFGYRKMGLGPTPGEMTLYVPTAGNLPITTRASLDRAAAEKHCRTLAEQDGRAFDIAETTVEVATFDSLDLAPDAIKIDVEGFEYHVLQGMTETLARHRPVLLLESNADDRACHDLLQGLGYRICYFDREAGRLSETPGAHVGNWFAIPESRLAEMAI